MSKAKRVSRNGDQSVDSAEVLDDSAVVVTTSRGKRVECLPITPMLDELQAEYDEKMPPAPTHTITDVAGSSIEIPYTDKTIENAPDDDKERWAKYIEEKSAVESELNERRVRIIATRGIRIIGMPPDDEWVKEHKFLGYDVPDGKLQRLYHYVKTEVIGTRDDGYKISVGIHRASGIDKEVLDKLEASFRGASGGPKGKDAKSSTQDNGKDEPGKEDGLVVQS